MVMVAEGGRTGQIAQIVRSLDVGRGPKAGLRLEDDTISRLHCRFEHADAEVTLRDLGSLNGTRLNGRSAKFEVLRSGDRIRVGRTLLIYFDEGGNLDELFEVESDSTLGPQGNEEETRAAGVAIPLEPA